MVPFSTFDRNRIKEKLESETFDLLIIGGGITGAGIALDASQRGLKTALVEMQDFAAGTSSRSTKLIHGGLRYLKQFEINLVAEVGKERAIVYENGPHVTTPEWMMLPFYKGGTFGPFTTNIGLKLYDYLAGVKKTERRKMLKTAEVMNKVPILKRDELLGAGYYVEYKTDDARLTIDVLKKAVELGAFASNYMKVNDFIYENDKVIGVKVCDEITNETLTIRTKKVINATGPWVDHMREIDGSKQGKTLHITKGVHLVFSQSRFPLEQAVYFDTDDGRMVFAIPRDGKTYVGTTDTTYHDDLANPEVTEEDRDYLLRAINLMFPSLSLSAEDIESTYTGLRPLIADAGKKPGEISRKDEIFISNSGLISIAGGKLTGYRKMAEKIVDLVVKQLQSEENVLFSNSNTKHLPISGGDVGGSKGFPQFKAKKINAMQQLGISEENGAALVSRYGSNIDILFHIYKELSEKHHTLTENELVLFTELQYGIEYEAVVKPSDFFIRRTGMMFFNIADVHEYKAQVIDFMAERLNWTSEQKEAYEEELTEQIRIATMKKRTKLKTH